MKIQILEFSLWKFKFQELRSIETSVRLIQMLKEIILEFLQDSIGIRILVDRLKKSIRLIENNSQSIENRRTEFSKESSSDYFKSLRTFQALWTVSMKILTLHTYLLKGYDPMGINRGLCSLEKIVSYKETQEILWVFSKIAICRTQ